MQNIIPLPTDDFYKFIALFGLLVSLFCFYFPVIFLKPYNIEILNQNLKAAELAAEQGFLNGKISDIEEISPEILKKTSVEYFWTIGNDRSKSIYYYSQTKDSTINNIIDKLNDLNFQLAKVTFKLHAMKISNKARQKNLHLNRKASYIIGTISTLLSIFGMFMWFKHQVVIDKKLKLEVAEIKEKIIYEKKKVSIECMEILNEIRDFYDTFPSEEGDKAFFEKINEGIRKALVKLKVLFANEDTRIIKRFEDANSALKNFVTMEAGERLKISRDARAKIKEFENVLIDYFQ